MPRNLTAVRQEVNDLDSSVVVQGLSEPEFYGDLVYKFKNIMSRTDFSDQFRKIIRHKRHAKVCMLIG